MKKNITSTSLALPQLTATLPRMTLPSHLLVSGGRPPEKKWLQAAAQGRILWAADHGLDACQSSGLIPAYCLGDGDSAAQSAWQWAESLSVPMDRFPRDKDYTDTQLAIKKAQSEGLASLLLTGVFGGRFDHTYNTLFSCAFAPLPCVLADDKEALFYLHGGENISVCCQQKPTAVSLIPFTKLCSGVTCRGLHWELTEATLLQSQPNATSNRLADARNAFSVSLGRGTLGVYLCWE